MCRCLKVSTSGFHAWNKRPLSAHATDNQRLLTRIREFHAASDGVMGMPRMHEDLSYAGETASRNRAARLMARDGLFGVPQKRSWQRKRTGVRPDHVQNHLEPDFSALEPNTKWVTDITYIHTAEGWLYLCTVALHRGPVVALMRHTLQWVALLGVLCRTLSTTACTCSSVTGRGAVCTWSIGQTNQPIGLIATASLGDRLGRGV